METSEAEWLWVKIEPFEALVPFTKVPLLVPIFDPLPNQLLT